MIEKKQIEQWLQENLITQEQAQKMIFDITQQKQAKTSSKITIALSLIGALFLGIGSILFVASNWYLMPNVIKVAILVSSTFGAYCLGYLFKYKLQNLPIVGAALLFLGSLLFGASIFLIAQIYQVNANNYTLVLIWIIGILPLMYAFVSDSIAVLSIVLSYVYIGLFLFDNEKIFFTYSCHNMQIVPVAYTLLGIFLFLFGAMHYFNNNLKKIARIYRMAGIQTVMLCLSFLSLKFAYSFFGETIKGFSIRPLSEFLSLHAGQLFFMGILIAIIFIILFSIINMKYNPSKSRTNILENALAITITLVIMGCFFIITTTNIYLLLFNFILLSLIFILIILGYEKRDMILVNTGMFWLVAFIVARYFDFFWKLMSRSLFFLIGGLLLLCCGIILERKRRELKALVAAPEKYTPIYVSHKKYLFILLGIFWFAIIGGYIAIKEYVLQTGQEVILKTIPVDPRDLFRGDYVRLRYPISTIDIQQIPSEKYNYKIGETIFVELVIKNNYAEASRITTKHKKGMLAIKGTIKNISQNSNVPTDKKLFIEYGIESYFVPEGRGREIEMAVGKNIDVKITISKSGKAVIKELLLEGHVFTAK